MTSDLIKEFRGHVELDQTRFKRPGQVFLCGGAVTEGGSPLESARHYLLHHFEGNHNDIYKKIVLAERIVGEQEQSGFQDLLELESLVAEIVAVVLLFVESPGALAELGAFSSAQSILERLVAVIEDQYREQTKSFIYLGPVRRLLRQHEDCLLYASWQGDGKPHPVDPALAEAMAESVRNSLKSILPKNGQTNMLSISNGGQWTNGEKMGLITGLLEVFQTLSKSLIDYSLGQFGASVTATDVNRYLYVLQKLGIVRSVQHSGQIWYYNTENLIHWSFTAASSRHSVLNWKRYFRDCALKTSETNAGLRKYSGAVHKVVQIRAGEE